MDADGVQVLHVADGDDVALVVAHDLILDLFPAGDALFHQDLMDGGTLDGYQLGDENESLLRLALDRAAGKTDRSGARTVSLLPYELTPMTVNPLFGKRIDNTLIDKIERKQIEECN